MTIGCVIQIDGETLEKSFQLGYGTSNEAEYQALIRGIELARELGCTSVEAVGDSELIVRQVQGEYSVNDEKLLQLWDRVISLVDDMDEFTIRHVPREENQRADALTDREVSG